MVPEFDKQSIINILQALDGAERAKYLKAHRNEIKKNLTFRDESEMVEFIFNFSYLSHSNDPNWIYLTTREQRLMEKCNSNIAAEMIHLLNPQLSTFDNFTACHHLLTRLHSFTGHDHLYPFRLALAKAMHTAIHNPQEMSQVAALLHKKDAAIFVKDQHKYWEKHQKQNSPVKNTANPAVLFAAAPKSSPEPSAPPAEYFEPPMAGK